DAGGGRTGHLGDFSGYRGARASQPVHTGRGGAPPPTAVGCDLAGRRDLQGVEGDPARMIGDVLKALFPTGGARQVTLTHDGLLHVLEGRRGRGKSYFLTDLIIRCVGDRVPVVTNT